MPTLLQVFGIACLLRNKEFMQYVLFFLPDIKFYNLEEYPKSKCFAMQREKFATGTLFGAAQGTRGIAKLFPEACDEA
jgi:hypothetical protein